MKRMAYVFLAAAVVAGVGCGGIVGNEASPADASASDAGSSSGGGRTPDAGARAGDSAAPDGAVCEPPLTLCAGACVDEQTDDANCGGCGLGCTTGCAAGRCVVTLYSTTMQLPAAIAVDSTSVYWTDNFNGFVMKVPVAGGTATTLAVAPGAWSLAIDATNVYFSGGRGPGAIAGSNVSRVPLQGGTPTLIASGASANVTGLAVDATHVYWGSDWLVASGSWSIGVASAPLAGGNASTLASSPASSNPANFGEPQGLASSGGDLFWADGPAVVRTPADGGATVTLQATPQNEWPISLVADATNVYFAAQGPTDGGATLVQQSLDGGAPLILEGSVTHGGVAVDERWVYYFYFYGPTGSCDAGPCNNGSVLKVPIGGGPRVTLATLPYLGYLPIAVDATSAYFATGSGVFKVTPK